MPRKSKKARKGAGTFWEKKPRSARKCFRCQHNYSSHIDVGCLKIVQLKPVKEECSCKEFVKDQVEFDMSERRLKLEALKPKPTIDF